MSRLRLFCGEETGSRNTLCQTEAAPTVSFQSYANRWRKYRNEPLDRARTLRRNDRCPHCSRATVQPLELADAVRSRNNLPIPGTATLVGFRCECCRWEWPA